MWKKIFNGGIVLGAISFCLLLGSYLILNHGFNAYGINLKIIEKVGVVSAFSIAVAVSMMAISWFSISYLLDRNKTLEEKTNSHLKFRENGDVDYDPKSRYPTFVQYNNVRRQIQSAKDNGQKEIMTNLSIACWEEIAFDGYYLSVVNENKDGYRHLIMW